MLSRFVITVMSVTILFTSISCNESTSPEYSFAKVRIVNLAYYAKDNFGIKKVRVIINNRTVIRELPYSFPSEYFGVKSGTFKLQFVNIESGDMIFEATVNVEQSKDYTIFVKDPINKPGYVLVSDDRTPDPNKAKIRLVSFGYLNSLTLNNVTNSPIISDIEYNTASEYVEVDPGEHSFIFTSSPYVINFSSEAVNIEAGKVYTIYRFIDNQWISDEVSPAIYRMLEDNQAGNKFTDLNYNIKYYDDYHSVRFVNESPENDGIIISINNRPIGNYDFRQYSSKSLPLNESLTFDIMKTSNSELLFQTDYTQDVRASFTYFVYNTFDDVRTLILKDSLGNDGFSRYFSFVHLSPDMPPVDIVDKSGNIIASDIGYGGATFFIEGGDGKYPPYPEVNKKLVVDPLTNEILYEIDLAGFYYSGAYVVMDGLVKSNDSRKLEFHKVPIGRSLMITD